jgi:hypothetical protein
LQGPAAGLVCVCAPSKPIITNNICQPINSLLLVLNPRNAVVVAVPTVLPPENKTKKLFDTQIKLFFETSKTFISHIVEQPLGYDWLEVIFFDNL